MRLIDADVLKKDLTRFYDNEVTAKQLIDEQPTIEPQPEPEEFEWCNTCKEYDQDKHCCHRWTKVIRETVEEFKQSQNIIHCKDCIHIHDNDCPISWGRQDFDYCSWAERREQ